MSTAQQLDLGIEPVCSRSFGHPAHDTTDGRCPGRPTPAYAATRTAAQIARLRSIGARHRDRGDALTAAMPLEYEPAHCAGISCFHDHRRTP